MTLGIENFVQGNVYPYQQRLKELDAENELLKAEVEKWHKAAMDAGVIVHVGGSTSHPMRGERDALKAENERLKWALIRARTHGVHSKMYHAFVAGDLADWIDKGMAGDLPEITSSIVRAELPEVR